MEPDPDQTATDFDFVERLFASVGERLEIVLAAAGCAESQNLGVGSPGCWVAPDQHSLALRQIGAGH